MLVNFKMWVNFNRLKSEGVGKMKKLLSLRLGRAVTVAALLVGAVGFAQQAAAGISATKHNLGTGGTSQLGALGGTDEICVFCHTPHAANTAAATSAPLWNKTLTATAYTTYATTGNGQGSLDGQILGVGSVSLACLSCHDGTQAMDNMINKPGSGGYNAGAVQRNGTHVDGLMTGVANLSQDLSNDHPIGIRYCGGGQNTTNTGAACTDADFVAPTPGTINGAQVWWVDTAVGGSADRQKTDMALYTRPFTTGTNSGSGPSVECGSCHDPHSSNTTFLRIANTGSAVCLACHNK